MFHIRILCVCVVIERTLRIIYDLFVKLPEIEKKKKTETEFRAYNIILFIRVVRARLKRVNGLRETRITSTKRRENVFAGGKNSENKNNARVPP